jgi:hypothetical protein
VVRVKGLEPPRLAAPEPKSGASTNSATPARFANHLLRVAVDSKGCTRMRALFSSKSQQCMSATIWKKCVYYARSKKKERDLFIDLA